jgi:hypothetical protein
MTGTANLTVRFALRDKLNSAVRGSSGALKQLFEGAQCPFCRIFPRFALAFTQGLAL